MFSLPSAAFAGTVAVVACSWIVGRAARRSADVDRQGWRRFRPSTIFPTLAVVSFAFLILPVLVWREEPVHTGGQVFILAVFVCVFAGLGLNMLYSAFGVHVRWNDHVIESRRWFRREQIFQVADIQRVENRQYDWLIRFKDGRRLSVSKFYGGSSDLGRLAERRARRPT
jgi:uncharacterized membrane protein YdbT with pleckstrin-like domain